MSTITEGGKQLILEFLGISKIVKTVRDDHFDLDYIAKFQLPDDRTRLRRRLIFPWVPGCESSQIEASLNYLSELILPQELKDKYPVFDDIVIENAQATPLTLNFSDMITVKGYADVHLLMGVDDYVLVGEFKKDFSTRVEAQVCTQLVAVATVSKLPVIAIATDLKQTFKLYWLERTNEGDIQIHCHPYLRNSGDVFFWILRAFIAGSMASLHPIRRNNIEEWMKPDSGFDPDYDEASEGRGLRLHRVRLPPPRSGVSGTGGADVTNSDVLMESDWNYFGDTVAERAENMYRTMMRYQGMSTAEVQQSLRQEEWEEAIESGTRQTEHESLTGDRLALLAR